MEQNENIQKPKNKSVKKKAAPIEVTKRLMTPEEACEYLQLPRSTFFQYLARGEIPKIKIGSHTRFHPELLSAWAKKKAS